MRRAVGVINATRDATRLQCSKFEELKTPHALANATAMWGFGLHMGYLVDQSYSAPDFRPGYCSGRSEKLDHASARAIEVAHSPQGQRRCGGYCLRLVGP